MKKTIRIISAAAVLSLLTACTLIPIKEEKTEKLPVTVILDEKKPDEKKNVVTSPEPEEEDITLTEEEEEEVTGYDSDFDSQLQLIADNFEYIKEAFTNEIYVMQSPMIAVTDFNRNQRLEPIISDTQGSGAFSYTCFFEVNEDFSGIDELRMGNAEEEIFLDDIGDFSGTDAFECYRKDGNYFYAVDDYTSTGSSLKGDFYFAYSFDGCVSIENICGYTVSENISEDPDNVYIRLYDSSAKRIASEQDYSKCFEDFWSEYEKEPPCEVGWVSLPEDDVLSALKNSFGSFNPDSEKEIETDYDFKTLVNGFYKKNYIILPSE